MHSNVVSSKEKRLKTRKERDHKRQGCGGQKHKSHSRTKQSCRGKEQCQGSYQPQSHSHNCEKFAKAFGPKEPSFITERRLLGHQGLFNHEVKSFDIERLLSEERRAERSKKPVIHTKKSLFSPTPSLTQNSGDEKKCPPSCKDEVSGKCSRQGVSPETESQTCVQSYDRGDSDTNKQGSGPLPCQRKTDGMDLSPSESNSVIVLSSTPKSTVSNNVPQSTPRISVEEHNSPKVQCAGSPIQTVFSNTNAQHSECTPTHIKPPVPYPKEQKPSNPPESPAAKDVTSASLDQTGKSGIERAQVEAKIARHLISVVADRLCQSLDRPLLLRHHLLAESRATLLHVLQERHGAVLQQNLLKLHTVLGLGQSQVDSGRGTGVHNKTPKDKWTATVNDVHDSDSGPNTGPQSWLGSQQRPTNKRRRKQKCPQKRTPPSPSPPQGLLSEGTGQRNSQALPWTLNMGNEQQVLMEPANPTSDRFSLGLQTTETFPTDGDDTFSSKWGPHPGLPHSWNKQINQEEIRPQTMSDSYEKWRHDPDLSFLCQTENQGQHQQSYSSYRAMPQDGALREPWHLSEHHPFDFQRHPASACFPDTAHTSLKKLQLQPYYRFHNPLNSAISSVTSYRPDMNFYPPSELLDMALSPRKPPSASPEGWSYPRMRLY
ncbi:uncharacterized protein si:dkey-250k15.4 isoform X2 [Alosa sapidissima]|nr:uncharacterized protein si:dkey-250k15.4 isoform X2 [Alosa sapidissima]XP_041962052.1 uncharacterized protein si:dkey-250k15.4 isoform X2 [Alosa sapidissima]XP_041962053.1 uncharacterized protein si:dkey-250k15.4 isoform X2 [Alosa sapidissima]